MKKSITISIPEPCHEDWAKMTATEKGKFCGVCTKEVIDFTKTTDEELVKRVTAGTNLCGRFHTSQLNREVKLERKSSNSLMPYAASLLLPLSMLSTNPMQSYTAHPTNKSFVSLGIGALAPTPVKKSIVAVTGVITDALGNPLVNTEIIVLETGESTYSLKDGSYYLKCASGSTLIFQKDNLVPQEIVVGNYDSTVHVALQQPIVDHQIILGRISPVEIEVPEKDVAELLENKVESCKPIPNPTPELMGNMAVVTQEIEQTSKITISGTVTDQNNQVLVGVNVIVKGTTIGTQTDFDGNYRIETEANNVLQFSYMGYDTKEFTTSTISNTIDLQLQDDDMLLGGLVVVSYIDGYQDLEDPHNKKYYGSEEAVEKRKLAEANQKAYQKLQQRKLKEEKRLKKTINRKR